MPPRLSTATVATGAAEERAVERRHQRRALAAGGDVAAAEVGDTSMPRELGQQGRRVQLQGVAGAVELARPMAHGLAVAADGRDLRRRRAPAARAASATTSA